MPEWFVRFAFPPRLGGCGRSRVVLADKKRHGIDQSRWHFLTGLKRDVYALSVGGLKFSVLDNDDKNNPDNLFIHSEKFVLVDKHGTIRGYFDGTEDEERRQLLLAVKELAREK